MKWSRGCLEYVYGGFLGMWWLISLLKVLRVLDVGFLVLNSKNEIGCKIRGSIKILFVR